MNGNRAERLSPNPWAAGRFEFGYVAIATALAYYLTARLGLALAIPPGHATVVWPPAGVALAAVILRGRSAWAGVLVGAFFANLRDPLAFSSMAEFLPSAAYASGPPAAIALGALTQAIIGAELVARARAFPHVAPSTRSMFAFFVLGGPLAALVSASVGNLALWGFGRIAPTAIARNWTVWWVGDIVGALALAPLILVVALAPKGHRWRRAATKAMAVVCAAVATAAVVGADLSAARRVQRADLEALSRELADHIELTVDLAMHAVEGLAGSFQTTGEHDLASFRALADRLAAFGLGIQALEWIPRVEREDLAVVEADMSRQWGTPFRIFERIDGKPHPVAARHEYFPVSFVTPLQGNEGAVGFDLASNPAREAALRKSELTGKPVATVGVKLVQNNAMGVLLFAPIYAENAPIDYEGERRGNLKGFALGVFSVPDLLKIALRTGDSAGLKYWLVDDTDPSAPAVLAGNNGEKPAPTTVAGSSLFEASDALGARARVKVADRVWSFVLAPTPAWLQRHADNSPTYLLVAGLFVTALIGGLFLVLAERQRQLVDSREHDLENQKFALDQHAIVSITDTRGVILYANDRFCKVAGYPRERLVGAKHSIVKSGVHGREVYQALWSTLLAGEVWRGELCNRSAAGELYWIEPTITPLKDPDGKSTHFIAICTDITARKNLEHELEASRSFLQSVADSMGEGVYTIDAKGRCTFLNAEGQRLLGYSFDEVKGKVLHDVVHFQDPDGKPLAACDCAIMHGLRRGAVYRSEDQYFTHRSGRLFPVSVVAKRREENGKFAGGAVVFQDISERRSFQDKLRRSEARLNYALSASSTGMWDFNPITGKSFYSATWFTMLGYEPKPTPHRGEMFFDLLHPDDLESYHADLARHVGDRSAAVESEFRMRRADGTWAWIRSVGRIIELDGEGQPLRMIGVHIDTSASHQAQMDLANAKDAAVRASQAKSEFLATMSHEIRTPMNAIIGLSHLLARSEMTARQYDYLSKIQGASTALLGVINDILDFSKIEAGKLTIEMIEFDLDEVIANVVTVIQPKIDEKNLALVVNKPPELPSGYVGDPLRLSQVLMNLLSNAAKFTAAGQVRVEFGGKSVGDRSFELIVSVIDSGIGMSAAQLEKLFAPFTQADTSTSRRFGGTGLGLAICRQILAAMGGDISVTSEEGAGTTFTFRAPLKLPPPSAQAERETAALRGKRALVVDDSRSARQILRAALTDLGITVEEAGDGAQARERLQSASFDFVVLDWKLPDDDGTEILAWMRARGVAAPALLTTAYGGADLERQLVAAFEGVRPPDVEIMEKPLGALQLRTKLLGAFGVDGASAPKPSRAPRTASDILLRDVRILLVEDNPINQQVAVGLLELLGVETTVAGSGEEALEILATRQFDAILMDMQMPGMDGLETTAAIRAEMGITDTPIIAMTANAMTGDRERCLESGMNDHIPKPIDPDRLALTLAHWLEATRGACVLSRAERPASPVRESEARRPALPGVDVAAALENLAGNDELFRVLLDMFVAEHARDGEKLAAAVAARERKRVFGLAHTLKGAGATLGAIHVAEISRRLETATRPDSPDIDLATLSPDVARLGDALAEVVAGIRTAQSARAESKSAPSRILEAPEAQSVLGAIDALAELLRVGDADAEPESERLAELLVETGARGRASAVASSASRYDFDGAQTALVELRAEVAAWSRELESK